MPWMETMTDLHQLPENAMLERLQRAAFGYFTATCNPHNGLVPDTDRPNSPVSIAVVGFTLTAWALGVSRGWMTRADALANTLAALRFFAASDQSGAPDATGYKGFYYHFLDMHSGKRVWQSELSMIDTALLIVGVLAAAQFFEGDDAREAEVRQLADMLYRRVDWRWAQDGGDTIRQGWKPECEFLHYGWEGYSEAIVLYVLALASPTHPVGGDCYRAWTMTYQWENLYHHDFLYAGPLFVHHFSHAWIDLRGIRDDFMRQKGSDYFENSRRAARIQREYAKLNPGMFEGYDANGWGLSACDGPTDEVVDQDNEPRRLFGYAARGVPYGPDDGTLCAPAVLSCLPFAPSMTLDAIRNLLARWPQILQDDQLASSFNPSVRTDDGGIWISQGHYGLDQGILMLMLENHRSGGVWTLMRGCPPIATGLRAATFGGGWLDEVSTAAGDDGAREDAR
jgi:hypothetical protein